MATHGFDTSFQETERQADHYKVKTSLACPSELCETLLKEKEKRSDAQAAVCWLGCHPLCALWPQDWVKTVGMGKLNIAYYCRGHHGQWVDQSTVDSWEQVTCNRAASMRGSEVRHLQSCS